MQVTQTGIDRLASIMKGVRGSKTIDKLVLYMWNHTSPQGRLGFEWKRTKEKRNKKKITRFLNIGKKYIRTTHFSVITGYLGSISISFLPAGWLIAFGLFQYRIFRVVPIARNRLFNELKEGIVFLDKESKVADYNPAFLTIQQYLNLSLYPNMYGIDAVELCADDTWRRAIGDCTHDG